MAHGGMCFVSPVLIPLRPEVQSAPIEVIARAPNKSLQRSGTHKVLGRGRPSLLLDSLMSARVLKWRRAAAELSR